jgi:TPR repeat protein
MYYQGKGVKEDFQEAFKWYQKAAKQGYAFAQCHLGRMYIEGKGVDKNLQEGILWYEKAAEQGDALAQYHLGNMRKSQ